MNQEIRALYQSVILKHNKEPLHFQKRESAQHRLEAYNAICGDRFNIYFDLENDKIENLSFHGFGCAISKASTSILTKHLTGKNLKQAKVALYQFFQTVQGEDKKSPEDYKAFAAAHSFPGRLKCATLSWDAFAEFIKERI